MTAEKSFIAANAIFADGFFAGDETEQAVHETKLRTVREMT
jgi:hypothetical protein